MTQLSKQKAIQMVDTSYFYVKVNGDPEGPMEWVAADKETTRHLENDDIHLLGYDDNGTLFTRCAEHPDQIQKWADFDDPMELARFALQNFLMQHDLDNKTFSPWGRPGAIISKDRYEQELTWGGYTFTFEEDSARGNHFICNGLILRPQAKDAPSRAETIALFENGFLGGDVVQYLSFNDWVSG